MEREAHLVQPCYYQLANYLFLFLNDVIYWLATSLNFCKYENNEILNSLQSLSYFVLLEELAGLPSDLTLSLIVVLSCQ